jgi:high-affinity nickel permease
MRRCSLFTFAAGQASGGMTFGTVMVFPALFTAGMALIAPPIVY